MKITQDEVIAKYPKIFKDYVGNPGRCNWYIPDGWCRIIDMLCGCIQHHVDTYYQSVENPDYDAAKVWDKDDVTTHRFIKINRPTQVECVQVKEKFGGLRFYTNGNDDKVDGMIRMAEAACSEVCIECGESEDLGYTKGWISITCKTCQQKNKGSLDSWISMEDYEKEKKARISVENELFKDVTDGTQIVGEPSSMS